MHITVISEAALELSNQLYGTRRPLSFTPRKIAHIAIDLQNGFLNPGNAAEPLPLHLIVPNVNKISAAVRKYGGLNVFFRFTYDPSWTARYRRFTQEVSEFMKAFTDSSAQHSLCSTVEVLPCDIVLNKTRLSGFTPGTCDLESVLLRRGIETLIVTGCFSNACCESTCRDAIQMNYNVVFVQDDNMTVSEADHNNTVANLYGIFGCDVCTTDEVVGRLADAAS